MTTLTHEAMESRFQRLYGPSRRLDNEPLFQRMKATSINKTGDYNHDESELVKSYWMPISTIDFKAQKPIDFGTRIPAKNVQLSSHFDYGNDEEVAANVYNTSTMSGDYNEENIMNAKKVKPIINALEPHWVDMTARFFPHKPLARSMYSTTFNDEFKSKQQGPMFPKRDTTKLRLPIIEPYAERIQHLRGVSVSLGSDPANRYLSESQKNFHSAPAPSVRSRDADSIRKMKEMEKSSHAMRPGDYNDEAPDSRYTSVFMADYGRPSVTTDVKNIYQAKKLESKETPSLPRLVENSLQDASKRTYMTASDIKKAQETRFNFGTKNNPLTTIYAKDFPSRFNPRASLQRAPKDSEVMHYSEGYKQMGGVNSSEYGDSKPSLINMMRQENGETAKRNMMKHIGAPVGIGLVPEAYAEDRKVSICHKDYDGPPPDFSTLPPQKGIPGKYNYIKQEEIFENGVMPRENTENKVNFASFDMSIDTNARDDLLRARAMDTKTTHFTVGDSNRTFSTEALSKFRGDPLRDSDVPAAGVKEIMATGDTGYIEISKNTQDLTPDPHNVSIMESQNQLRRHEERRKTEEIGELPLHRFSIMQNDYKRPERNTFTDSQVQQINAISEMDRKPVMDSHLFHMDSLETNRFQTTAQADFVEPTLMTGRKLLAAR